MKESQLFRKKSLEKLSSPEQLDQLMVVTSPFGWVSLICAFILIITAIVWSIFGTLSTKVDGTGILIKGGGVNNVVHTSSGRLSEFNIKTGDIVKSGEIVAIIEQPELADRIRESKAKLDQLAEQRRIISEFGTKDMQLQMDSLEKQRSNLDLSIRVKKNERKWYKEKLEIQKELLREGLITIQTLKDTQRQLDSVILDIEQSRDKIKSLSINQNLNESQREQELLSIQHRIEEQKIVISSLEYKYNLESNVISPYSGRVLEIMVEVGDIVRPNVPIFNLELEGKDIKGLEAVIFVAATDGKKVTPGMSMQISPATVKKEEYGSIMAIATSVSEFPATYGGMMHILNNQSLVNMLSGSGAPIKINADLLLDNATISGYKWTSSKGPPTKIFSGTICNASIIVRKRSPISQVFPLLKKHILGKESKFTSIGQ